MHFGKENNLPNKTKRESISRNCVETYDNRPKIHTIQYINIGVT